MHRVKSQCKKGGILVKKNNETVSAETFLSALIEKVDKQQWDISTHREIVEGLNLALQEIKEIKEHDLREIGNYLYDGIYIADGNGKTIYINEAYTRITGITSKEVVGKYVEELVAEGLFSNAVTPEVIKHKKQVNAMAESSKKRGMKMLVTGIPILDAENNVKKVVVIDRQITDLMDMKTELEASQKQIKAVERADFKKNLEIEHLRKITSKDELLGGSLETEAVIKAIKQVAHLDVTVLITGETGSGKEVVANEIYRYSARKKEPFIKVNCAAIPAALLEAELFGYAKGAFTGASSTGKLGLFELADKGTLLLDEIGDMPLELQAKLLRVIQQKEVTRIGGIKPIKLDVRILSSTNCQLHDLVKQGRFRSDLYYRLNVFPIYIPPLRERVADIPILVQYFLSVYNSKHSKQSSFEPLGLDLLQQYPWPGNVRELQNIIERLVIISEQNAIISSEQVGHLLNINPEEQLELAIEELGLKDIVNNIEKKTIEKALALYGSTRKVAKILKVDQSTIVKKAKKLGIHLTDERSHQL